MKLFFTLIILLPIFSFAQGNYKPGYVVTLKGDTIQGFINYKDWNKNPTSVGFKKDINSAKTETYSTVNISAFAVTGIEYYKRFAGKVSQDATDVSYLSKGIDTIYKIDAIFLRVISKGKNATLYEYDDILKTRYFISANNTPIVELAYHLYYGDDNKVEKERGYMAQLQRISAAYQPQNSVLIDEIANVDYTSDDLKKIVFKINGSVNTSTSNSSFTAANHAGARVFIGAGANYTNTYFVGTDDFVIPGSYSSVLPLVNVGVDILLNKDVGNFIVRTALGFSGSNVSFVYDNNRTGIADAVTTYKFNQYGVTLNPQLLYNFHNTNTLKLYGAAGCSVGYSFFTNQEYYIVQAGHTTQLGQTSTGVQAGQAFVNVNISPTAKIGLVLNNKLDIYFNYIAPTSFDVEETHSTKRVSYQAGINLFLGK